MRSSHSELGLPVVFQFRLFQLFFPVLMLLERNMDFQNTFLGGNDFSTSTAKQLSFSDNQIFARELLKDVRAKNFYNTDFFNSLATVR